MAVSHATRACGSWASIPSSTASETWSQTLSGCPSVTDSEVKWNDGDALKEVVTTAANDTCEGKMNLAGKRSPSSGCSHGCQIFQRGVGGRAPPGRNFVDFIKSLKPGHEQTLRR